MKRPSRAYRPPVHSVSVETVHTNYHALFAELATVPECAGVARELAALSMWDFCFVADLFAKHIPAQSQRRGRQSFLSSDLKILFAMKVEVEAGATVAATARKFAPQAEPTDGSVTPESKITRLERQYRKAAPFLRMPRQEQKSSQ